jgi:spermidine synthase
MMLFDSQMKDSIGFPLQSALLPMTHLIVIGFISILGQVTLLRELNVASYGVDLVYSLALGVWLFWTACGAYLSHKTLNPSQARIGSIFLLFSTLLPLDIVFIRSIRPLFSKVPGAYLDFETQILSLLAALLPLGLLSGILFQRAAKIYITKGKTLASAYALESFGGIIGGACSTLLIMIGVSNFRTALVCSLIPMTLILGSRDRRKDMVTTFSAAACGLLLLAFWQATAIDRHMTSWTHPNLLATTDSPYGRITIQGIQGQVSVFENDALVFETEGTEAEEFVQLAALQHAKPERVLVLGGGVGGAIKEILMHSPKLIDYVELNPLMIAGTIEYLPAAMTRPLESPQTRISFADPRRFLADSGVYDLILVNMPEPDSGQANRFYTREFFHECQTHLNPGGLIAFKLKSSENLWTPQLTKRTVSIYRAAKAIFRDVLVLPGTSNIVMCSSDMLTRDPEVLVQRFSSRKIQAKLVSPAYINYLYTNDRFSQIADILNAGVAPANSDAWPICYQYTVMIWLSKFFPSFASVDLSSLLTQKSAIATPIYGLSAALVLFLIIARRRYRLRRTILMGIAGFLGMAVETLLMLYYQAKNGVLFRDIGILLTSFMAGLAMGALLVGMWSNTRLGRQIRPAIWGGGILIGFAVLGVVTANTMNSLGMVATTSTSLMLFAAGFLVSGILAYSGYQSGNDQSAAVGTLYAADLIGGCLASLAVGLVLAPLVGLAKSASWMSILAIAAALFL